MLRTCGYYILYMLSTLRSTENWSHFFSWRGRKPEDFKHAHDSCIYCTEWVVELHDDLCLLAQHPVFLSFWKGNSAAVKPLLNSRCKSQREKKNETNTQMPEHKISSFSFFLTLKTLSFTLQSFPFLTEQLSILVGGCRGLLCHHLGAALTGAYHRLGF